MAAWNGLMPSSMWRKMFSSTTMASSTTRPMASTSASSVSVLMVKPARCHEREGADQADRDGDQRDDAMRATCAGMNTTSATSTTARPMVL